MSTSKLKMFSQLYTKDMRELVPEIVIVAAAAVILNGLFYFNMNRYTSFHPAVFIIPTLWCWPWRLFCRLFLLSNW